MILHLIKGDITKLKVDCIVNAANSTLLGGGGVDGAIHNAGGPQILRECQLINQNQGGCKTGEVVYTSAGKLPCKFVIHTVGPIFKDGTQEEHSLLRNCYVNALNLAEELGIKSLALPNISTGAYGFPKQEAAEIAIKSVKEYIPKSLENVYFICFDDENYQLYSDLLTINQAN